MKRLIVIVASLACLALWPLPASAETGFLDRTVTVAAETYNYQVYVPQNWTNNQTWPVILFLHGAGERGSDGLLPTQVGIGTAIRRDRSRFAAIVVFPQSREGRRWSDTAMQEQALAALDAATKEFNGDPDRLYAAGLSLGGQGVIRMASRSPNRFAAIVAVCGPYSDGGKADEIDRADYPYLTSPDPFAALAATIKSRPIWLFHGDADKAVPVEQSRKLAEALKAAEGDVHYTEYPGVGHNSWDPAFAESQLWDWLFAQKKGR
jgi:predicted peptidase